MLYIAPFVQFRDVDVNFLIKTVATKLSPAAATHLSNAITCSKDRDLINLQIQTPTIRLSRHEATASFHFPVFIQSFKVLKASPFRSSPNNCPLCRHYSPASVRSLSQSHQSLHPFLPAVHQFIQNTSWQSLGLQWGSLKCFAWLILDSSSSCFFSFSDHRPLDHICCPFYESCFFLIFFPFYSFFGAFNWISLLSTLGFKHSNN